VSAAKAPTKAEILRVLNELEYEALLTQGLIHSLSHQDVSEDVDDVQALARIGAARMEEHYARIQEVRIWIEG